MDAPYPSALLLAAPPDAPGARAVVARAQAAGEAGRPVRVLLSDRGLAWAGDPGLAALVEAADVAVCSRNAREAGWTAGTSPAGVRWSSVATWLATLETRGPGSLWTVLP